MHVAIMPLELTLGEGRSVGWVRIITPIIRVLGSRLERPLSDQILNGRFATSQYADIVELAADAWVFGP